MEVYNKMEISRLAGMYLARLVDIVYIPPVKHGGGSHTNNEREHKKRQTLHKQSMKEKLEVQNV
jgi:hypothetical protein